MVPRFDQKMLYTLFQVSRIVGCQFDIQLLFHRYCNSQRQIVLNENPGITHQDLTKLISVNWNNLDMEEKQVSVLTLERRIEINWGRTVGGQCMAI